MIEFASRRPHAILQMPGLSVPILHHFGRKARSQVTRGDAPLTAGEISADELYRYEWAGQVRTVAIAKGHLFCLPQYIESSGLLRAARRP